MNTIDRSTTSININTVGNSLQSSFIACGLGHKVGCYHSIYQNLTESGRASLRRLDVSLETDSRVASRNFPPTDHLKSFLSSPHFNLTLVQIAPFTVIRSSFVRHTDNLDLQVGAWIYSFSQVDMWSHLKVTGPSDHQNDSVSLCFALKLGFLGLEQQKDQDIDIPPPIT